MNRRISLILCIVFAFIISVPTFPQTENSGKKAKYVFLFIGDGMGLGQIQAAEAYLGALNGKPGTALLNLNRLPAIGLTQTWAENRFITGSAAAGTALATGYKTTINTIGMNGDRTAPLYSIASKAHKAGKKVGIISNVSINHATPAAFYAHRPDRNDYYEIALQLPESGFDLFGFGGMKESRGKKNDQPDAYEMAMNKGYHLVKGKSAFMQLERLPGKTIVVNDVIEPEDASVPYVIDQDSTGMKLSGFVRKSISLLDNPHGFFIMVEGGLMDWACHSNDAATTIHEVLDFDAAIGAALDFMKQHPDETLIVVTADHETGGMSLGSALTKYEGDFRLLSHQKVSQVALKDAVHAFRSSCQGNCTLDKFMPVIASKTGLGKEIPLTDFDRVQIQMAFRASIMNQMPFPGKESNYLLYGDEDPLSVTLVKIMSQKAGVGWTTWSHTGVAVPVRALGVNQTAFCGYLQNTDIPRLILESMGLPASN